MLYGEIRVLSRERHSKYDAIASLVSPRVKYKINKLLGNECYSSAKLEAFGFKAKKSLKDMNETDF